MIILGIETSCDDTCASLVEIKQGKLKVLTNIISSQAKIHSRYGGVVPELAARNHIQNIIPVIDLSLRGGSRHGGRRGNLSGAQSDHKIASPPHRQVAMTKKPDAIAVTTGPGLITSLIIGVETAKSLSFAWDIPLIEVNHIEGHIYSPLLPSSRRNAPWRVPTIKFPAVALVVSGGHTELILMSAHGKYKLLGRTRDDAAGEAFDKTAKMLGLGYPGGPLISKLATKGNAKAFSLPRPMTETDNFEFSFSGLKNAIRLLIENIKNNSVIAREPRGDEAGGNLTLSLRGAKQRPPDGEAGSNLKNQIASLSLAMTKNLAASTEQAIVDVLVQKSLLALKKYKPKSFILSGGVSANKKLRQTLQNSLPKSINFLMPKQNYTQDNAAMIALAGYYNLKNKKQSKKSWKAKKIQANANWELVN